MGKITNTNTRERAPASNPKQDNVHKSSLSGDSSQSSTAVLASMLHASPFSLRIFEVTPAAGRTLGPVMLAQQREHKSQRQVCPAFALYTHIIKMDD